MVNRNEKGPRPSTLDRIARVRLLISQGEKLTWALAEVGLTSSRWYHYAGWRACGAYKRKVYVRRAVVDRLMTAAEVLMREGKTAQEACRAVGLCFDTFYARRKRKGKARP